MKRNATRVFWWVGGAGCWLGLLAGCQGATKPAKEEKAGAAPTEQEASSPTTGPPYTGYHRYQGTVGSQPVTMMLTIGPDQYDSTKTVCAGAYYYGTARRGLLDLVNTGTYQPRQPMQLDESAGDKNSGTWRATQPVGPLLSGTWTSPNGKQLPFELRETYQDAQGHQLAVRYEVLKETTYGPVCKPEGEEADSTDDAELSDYEQNQRRPSELYRDALHLLGPDTLRPALRAIQCPVPRQRRRGALAFAADDGACSETSESVSVAFNDFGLLSLSEPSYTYYYGAPHFNHAASSTTYDLRTGEEVSLENILRAGASVKLQRLLTRHLLHDQPTDGDASVWKNTYGFDADQMLAPLPAGLALSYTGLVCLYGEADISASLGYVSLEVPYTELLPLLRPNSPVARMLRERGLWRGNAK